MLLEKPSSEICRCIECLRDFPVGEVMQFECGPVCVECKPMALAKLESGKLLGTFWRKGKTLVMVRKGAAVELPERCIVCNEPLGNDGLKSTTYWAPSLVVLFGLMPLVWAGVFIIYLVDRERCRFGLCRAHVQERRRLLWAQGGLQFGGLAVLIVGLIADVELVTAIGFAMFASALVLAVMMKGELREMWRTRSFIYLRGGGRKFLAEFPEWREGQ